MISEGDHYLLFSFMMILAAKLPLFLSFERKKMDAREIVLIAMLAAIAAVSRIPFAGIPSVQPTSFVIIVAGLVFGAHTGFMIGAIAALVSNMFLGQGPWTPWQMFGWGMMGLTAGLLKDSWLMMKVPGRLLFGFVWGFLFGWIMNLWFIIGFVEEITLPLILGSMASSFYFDLMHALSNCFFLALFGTGWIKILNRFKRKYGLLRA